MTKLFEAECTAEVVQVGGHPAINPEPIILSQGTKASEGVYLMCGSRTFYIANTVSDMVDFLDKVASVLGTISGSMTEMASTIGDAGLIISTAAKVATVNGIASQLNTMKGNLK